MVPTGPAWARLSISPGLAFRGDLSPGSGWWPCPGLVASAAFLIIGEETGRLGRDAVTQNISAVAPFRRRLYVWPY
jgi:hypothetical protein